MSASLQPAAVALVVVAILVVALVAALYLGRRRDERADAAAWARLAAMRSIVPERFDPAMVADLPEPARRFFRFAIAPGARLGRIVELSMAGELSLGTKEAPRCQPMRASQLLCPPNGLVWRVVAGRGAMRIAGSDAMVDGRSWSRFRLLGLLPVARAGGGPDHLRSAFGRVVAEAAFWAPASLLPQNGVGWELVDADTARATVRHLGMTQSVDVRVDEDGRPVEVAITRWTDANPERTFRLQPFGGRLADFREVDGYRLPFRVEGGNFFGTERYFPFYRASVEAIRMLPANPSRR